MEKIKRLVVEYDNGQTEEFIGIGHLRRINTSVTEDRWEGDTLKKSERPVRVVEASVSVP